jgi:tRNA threonylcarbamoyladenosine biosynthesis protein TsaB
VLALANEVLGELGAGPADLGRVLTGDGPGSFTGLRVAAAVAKALAWRRPELVWRTAPSLLIRAMGHAPDGGGTVLALSDALRGELYAGCWRLAAGRVERVGGAPRTVSPGQLGQYLPVDVVVGSFPERLRDDVVLATGREPITGEAALPDARRLLDLDGWSGGTEPVVDTDRWQPTYGRPAEAQAVWERKHGRPLPDPSRPPR